MNETIPCSPQFIKQLQRLERTGKKGEKAAETARRIIHQLAGSARPTAYLLSKQTKSGENRLNNIEKYDLGAGYRLICRRRRSQVTLEFIGSHDDSDLWLNHHRGTDGGTVAQPPPAPATVVLKLPPRPAAGSDASATETANADPYEERLSHRLDDQLLRQVFGSFLTPARNRTE